LPEPLRGFNSCYFGKREIVIANDQTFPAATLHTLLHEMREIIEREFADLGWPTVQSKESDFEERAECFATAVQVFAVIQLVPGLLQNASEIQRKWVRIGVYAMIFTGTILYTLTFASLPRIEDAFLIKSTQ
jgi:tellurite resistance protein TehA-like permease